MLILAYDGRRSAAARGEHCSRWASGHLEAIDDSCLAEGAYANHDD